MRDYSLRFGIPRIPLRILSDKDPAFEAKFVFSELIRLLGLKKQHKSGYNPRSNGIVEQANRSVNPFLPKVFLTHTLHNDPPLYKILVKVISDHLYCNPGISPDIKDFKFPAIIISVWYLHFR